MKKVITSKNDGFRATWLPIVKAFRTLANNGQTVPKNVPAIGTK